MRDAFRTCKKAIRTLGPAGGMRFAVHSAVGNGADLAVSVTKDGVECKMWARPRSTDLAIITEIFRRKEYQFSQWGPYWDYINEQYRASLSGGRRPLIVDGGANAGYSAIWFAADFPEATIIAVEPDPANFRLLQRNVGGLKNVIPVQAALWNEVTSVCVVDPKDGAWGRRFDVAASGSGIPSVTVPGLLGGDAAYRPLIMKVDIEGAETKLFRSNTDWVDQFPLVIFEPHDPLFQWLGPWQGSAHSFFSTLSRRKREYLINGENIFAFLHPHAVAQ